MQIGSVGLNNFTGRNAYYLSPACVDYNDCNEDDIVDAQWREVADNETTSKKSVSYEDAVNKAGQNVHPTTVFASVGIMLAAALKGKKVVAIGRKAVVTAGEYISRGIVGAGSKISKIFKNNDLSSRLQKTKDKITQRADILRDSSCAKDKKLLDGVQTVASKLLGEKKGESIRNFMEKMEITNPVRIFDTVIAAAFGIGAVDKTSDVVEGALDGYDINKAKENDPVYAVKELFYELAE